MSRRKEHVGGNWFIHQCSQSALQGGLRSSRCIVTAECACSQVHCGTFIQRDLLISIFTAESNGIHHGEPVGSETDLYEREQMPEFERDRTVAYRFPVLSCCRTIYETVFGKVRHRCGFIIFLNSREGHRDSLEISRCSVCRLRIRIVGIEVMKSGLTIPQHNVFC